MSIGGELQRWFGLSYASWLTVPRVLMEAMPVRWQNEMARLLEEYSQAFPRLPALGTRVQTTRDGRLVKTPPWLLHYRHPDEAEIAAAREAVGAAEGWVCK